MKATNLNNKTLERVNLPKLTDHRRPHTVQASIAPKLIEVTFGLDKPGAQEVYLCGDFNQWSPTSLRMIRMRGNDHWEKRLTLAPGRYQYKFVVDGAWVHDPEALENVPNHYGSINSVLEVHE